MKSRNVVYIFEEMEPPAASCRVSAFKQTTPSVAARWARHIVCHCEHFVNLSVNSVKSLAKENVSSMVHTVFVIPNECERSRFLARARNDK